MGDGENPPIEHLNFAMAYDYLDEKDKIEHLYFSEIGFALAIVTCNVFMRDIPKILGTGLIVGHDLVGKLHGISQDESSQELTLKKTTIIAMILSQNMVDSMDVLSSISTITAAINMLTTLTTLRASVNDGIF
jgi:hypothetical protein